MDKILVRGGKPLRGTVHVRGAKNAALPLMACAILAEEPCVLDNVPCLHDIFSMDKVLSSMGVRIDFTGRAMTLDASAAPEPVAPYDLVRKMRASFFVLGPLLGRCGKARVSLPGGCAIGTRPVDLHLKGLEAMGVAIRIEDGYVIAEGRPKGADFSLDYPSVGATENIMMAAARADGVTRLSNAAREPEIEDLARFLNGVGARISGAGTDLITVVGVDSLGGTEHVVMPDRIEAVARGVAKSAGADLRYEARIWCPAVDNNPEFTARVMRHAVDLVGQGSIFERRITGSDDMAYFLENSPGCYLFLGGAEASKPIQQHHQARFNIDDNVLPLGLELALRVIDDFLS